MENKLTREKLKELNPSWDNLVKLHHHPLEGDVHSIIYCFGICDDEDNKHWPIIAINSLGEIDHYPLSVTLAHKPKKKRRVIKRTVDASEYRGFLNGECFVVNSKDEKRGKHKIKIVVCDEDKE